MSDELLLVAEDADGKGRFYLEKAWRHVGAYFCGCHGEGHREGKQWGPNDEQYDWIEEPCDVYCAVCTGDMVDKGYHVRMVRESRRAKGGLRWTRTEPASYYYCSASCMARDFIDVTQNPGQGIRAMELIRDNAQEVTK